ncbi:MAG: alanine--tRNA ligase [Planctomycetota bacterium]
MRTDEIRAAYLKFFEERGHRVFPSDSLVPANDPTLLFTGAGMNQFKDEFLGLGRRSLKRAASAQKCLRTGDIRNVGVTSGHHTFFEMLGNFSFGDYFKKEAIAWAWEFLTKTLRVPERLLRVSVYREDEEAFTLWREEIGLSEDRIARLGPHDNFWPADAPALGPNGPCGPCSEIFYDRGESHGCGRPECGPACGCGRHVEVWNLVFTQFDRQEGGALMPLPRKNIDTGMGLERMAACLQGAATNMDIDIFQPVVRAVAERSGRSYGDKPETDVLMRRIADHARAAVFCIADGVLPANTHRGYVLKRLLRRAVLDGRGLGIEGAFLHALVPVVGGVMAGAYPELARHASAIAETVKGEEEKFLSTLARGLGLIDGAVRQARALGRDRVDGATAFELHDTYGFPFELAEELLAREGLSLDREGFDEALEAAREKARAGARMKGEIFAQGPLAEVKRLTDGTEYVGETRTEAAAKVVAVVRGRDLVREAGTGAEVEVVLDRTPFYAEAGGQIGDMGVILGGENLVVEVLDTQKADGIVFHAGTVASGTLRPGASVRCEIDAPRRAAIARNHTSAHLLHWALREVLGPGAEQRGSWVGPDRMRFDFRHGAALSEGELDRVEDLVNRRILENAPLSRKVLPMEEARKAGAVALFGEKYGATVRMVSVADFSRELCGGSHVERTGDLGAFRILAEESIAAGIRRIESCTGLAARHAARAEAGLLAAVARALKVPPEEAPARLKGLLEEERRLRKELAALRRGTLGARIAEAAKRSQDVDGVPCLSLDLGEADARELREATDAVRAVFPRGVALLGAVGEEKASLLALVSREFQDQGLRAGDIVQAAAAILGGRGGGRPDMAQAGGREPKKLPQALQALPEIVRRLRRA